MTQHQSTTQTPSATQTPSDTQTADTFDEEPSSIRPGAVTSTDELAYEITYEKLRIRDKSEKNVVLDALFEIENTGSVPITVKDFSVDIESVDGELLAVEDLFSRTLYNVAPGEKVYFWNDYMTVNDSTDRTQYAMRPSIKVEQARGVSETFDIDILSCNDTSSTYYSSVEILGKLINNTSKSGTCWGVRIVLFDSNNIPLCVAFSNLGLPELEPGETQSFSVKEMLPVGVSYDDIAYWVAFSEIR